jgi:hypothetical protein
MMEYNFREYSPTESTTLARLQTTYLASLASPPAVHASIVKFVQCSDSVKPYYAVHIVYIVYITGNQFRRGKLPVCDMMFSNRVWTLNEANDAPTRIY